MKLQTAVILLALACPAPRALALECDDIPAVIRKIRASYASMATPATEQQLGEARELIARCAKSEADPTRACSANRAMEVLRSLRGGNFDDIPYDYGELPFPGLVTVAPDLYRDLSRLNDPVPATRT